MKFRFRGYIVKGVRKLKFTKEIEAPNEKLALEKLYSILGSNHKVKRVRIIVEGVEKLED